MRPARLVLLTGAAAVLMGCPSPGALRITGVGGGGGASAARLVFIVQPSSAVTDVEIAPAVQVAVQDTLGNTNLNFSGGVTIALGANPGGSLLSGTKTVVASAGVAMFANLILNQPGTGYTLAATAIGVSGATSGSFTISAPPAGVVTKATPFRWGYSPSP